MHLADGLAAAESGQGLLRELRRLACLLVAVIAGKPVDRPGQYHDCRRKCGEQQRRRGTTARHGPMLRMCQLLLVFRHGSWTD